MAAEDRQRRAVEVGVRIVERQNHRAGRQRAAGPAAGEVRCSDRVVSGGVQVIHLGRELAGIDDESLELAGGTDADAVVHEHRDRTRGALRASVRQMRAHCSTSVAAALACLRRLLM